MNSASIPAVAWLLLVAWTTTLTAWQWNDCDGSCSGTRTMVVDAFSPGSMTRTVRRRSTTRLFDNNEKEYYNPIDYESPEERAARMELVRKLQRSFYQPETESTDPEEAVATTTTTSSSSAAILVDLPLPLWRVQWTELPGYQNVLNVHVPHYTRYSGDGTSSGDGSENLDNPDHALQKGDMGVLMRISDSRQHTEDGRLTLVVQALERFRIHRVVRSHSPYAIADVELVVDEEQTAGGSSEAAVARALESHPFEYRRVLVDECELARDQTGRLAGVAISPLSNYDGGATTATTTTANKEGSPSGEPTQDAANLAAAVAIAERDTWLKLDELLNLLSIASQGEIGVPVPSQILGLLPRTGCALLPGMAKGEGLADDGPSLVPHPWPEDFFLEKAVAKLEAAMTKNKNGAGVGTYSKSPFVRVDAEEEDPNKAREYCPLRRAQRLSYVIWTLTESIDLDRSGNDTDRESLLRIDSTRERLELAVEKIDRICMLLQQIIRMQGA
eukprot:jgi/Psemu1/290382/fgenesh1_pg.490_\